MIWMSTRGTGDVEITVHENERLPRGFYAYNEASEYIVGPFATCEEAFRYLAENDGQPGETVREYKYEDRD